MSDYQHLNDFLDPVDTTAVIEEQTFNNFQFGHYFTGKDQTDEEAEIVLLGIDEHRGDGFPNTSLSSKAIRRQLYPMYHWHQDIRIADIGNVRCGATLKDTYAALKTVIAELLIMNKTVIILGGSHDLTTAQYETYATRGQIIEASVVDALIDLHEEEAYPSRHFLMDMLTKQPNYIRHYNHIGFQSYFIHPGMLETLDKLRFDCYRLGMVRDNLEDMEPVIRQSDMLSFDISALRHADAPANRLSPNGFAGDEACTLMRYAGMSNKLSTLGIYGYKAASDRDELTAIQIAQMIWYFLDGYSIRNQEANLNERNEFLEFHVSFTDVATSFLKSKRTGRWWMQLPDEVYIPCAYKDYLAASNNEIPERWLRAQERI